jgi:predicted amidohydrolase YtcJ
MRYYRHPRIFTGTGEADFAGAFAVRDGVFAWVGGAADVPEDADVQDLSGGVVLPGLIDAHTHPTYIAQIVDAVACTVPEVTSIPEMVEALRGHRNVGKGDHLWIEGWGYDESKLVERRSPTRHDLDLVSTTQPVYVLRSDAHSGICNTRALELAGITRDTVDPPAAEFGRDPDGTPNGVLKEHGANQPVVQAKGSAGFEADVAAMVRTSNHLARRGIVAVTDMFCVPAGYEQLDLYRAAAAQGFRQTARVFYDFDALKERPIRPVTDADREGRTRVAGVKLFMDGSMSNRTAWMRDAYRDDPEPDRAVHGMRLATDRDLADALVFCRANRLQLAIHAMGDAAITHVVDVLGDEEPWLAGVPSVRIEHATLLDAALVARLRDSRMVFGVATNVNFLYAEHDSYVANLTDEQFARAYAVKELYEQLGPVALSSDCPATTWYDPDDPFMSIQAAVTRRAYNGAEIGPGQAVTLGQALMLYTGRARLLSDFGAVGQIAPGFEASFVTVDRDLFEIDPETVIGSQVTGTWIGGDQVFSLG